MIDRRPLAASAALALTLGGLTAPAALAGNHNATASYGTFTCSDSRTFDITGIATPRFPIHVGFMDGKGVVARWFDQSYSAKIVLPAEVADDAVAFAPDPFSGPATMSRRASSPDLSSLATCTSAGEATSPYTLDAAMAEMFGLPASSIGTPVMVHEAFSLTVYITTQQVAAR